MDKRHLQMVLSFLFASSLTACGGSGSGLSAPSGTPIVPAPAAEQVAAVRTTSALSALPAAETSSIAIDAGGAATSGWIADTDYSTSGMQGTATVSTTINTSGVASPAPQAVYQSQRYAAHLTYAIPNLTPSASYTVRLHLVESYWTAAGKRIFSVKINGVTALTNFDIFATAHGENNAIVEQFTSKADTSGKITIQADASVDNVTVAGIQVTASGSPTPAPSPKPTATATPISGTYADANLPPAGWQFPYGQSPFTVAACTSDPCSPSLDADSASEVNAVMSIQSGGLDLGDIYQGNSADNDFPVYYASSSDPTYTVTCDNGNGCGTGTITVKIPNGAYASSGSDHHLSVIDQATGVESDFWEFNDNGTGYGTTTPVSGGGSVRSGSGGVCQANSFAGKVNACANGAVAAGTPVQPTMLDPREVLAGSINHALYVALGCGQSSFVYPAKASDGSCSSGPKYGQRIWLDLSDAQINALGDPAWASTMLHAMHHYGWIVSDTNGGGAGIGFANLAAQTFTLWGESSPWSAFWSAAGGGGHAAIPTKGISQSNVHILAPCVNTQSC